MNPPDYENPINYDPETGKYLVVPFMDRYTFLIILLVNSFLILVIMCGLLIFCLRKSDLNSSFFRNIQWFATCCGKYDKNNNNTNRNARSNSIDLTIQGSDLNNSISNPNNPSSSSNNPISNTNTQSGNLRTQNSNPNNLDDNRNNNRVSNARTIATTPSHYYSIVSVDDED
ncbi:hypothetical protein NEIG_00110 [Nematocida sp. ERTm5]|nr:hypothetical protein NEIG_00110 [Nematocida sp. ERTm5]